MSAAPASPVDHVQTSVDRLLTSFDAGSGMRTEAIAALQTLCSTIGYDVVPFGSHTIGTALPGSDVDVTVRHRSLPSSAASTTNYASFATKAMRKAGLLSDHELLAVWKALRNTVGGPFTHVEFVSARVPLITCRYKGTVEVDIAFKTTGVETSTFLHRVLTPDAIKLVRLFKFLLQRWQLNDSHRGGIGSLVASLMVLHFLQERSSATLGRPIGQQFVGFLEFWVHFDYRSQAIRFCSMAVPICRAEPKALKSPAEELVIMHPIDTSRNAASGANRFVRDVLPRMHQALSWLSSTSMSNLDVLRTFGTVDGHSGDADQFGQWWSKHGTGDLPYRFAFDSKNPRQALWTCTINVTASVVVIGQGTKKKAARRAAASEIVALLGADPKLFTR